jgi:hypothetical protein
VAGEDLVRLLRLGKEGTLLVMQVMGTDERPESARVTQEQLNSMFNGQPAPWEAEGSVGEGRRLHYGRKFHQVCCAALAAMACILNGPFLIRRFSQILKGARSNWPS